MKSSSKLHSLHEIHPWPSQNHQQAIDFVHHGIGECWSEKKMKVDIVATSRIHLTKPSDSENELLKVAAFYGPPGILAVLRARNDHGWFVALALRAIEVCLGPRPQSPGLEYLEHVDPVGYAMRMYEMEMIDEILSIMLRWEDLEAVQRAGLSIIELLIVYDPDWRDELARKGGVKLLCDIARRMRNCPNIMCQIMTCMSYLAAEDYIEIMLCQHEALEYVTYVIRYYTANEELVTRASLALLNLTVCESHILEVIAKDSVSLPIRVLQEYADDVHIVLIACGILANFSAVEEARKLLVEAGLFECMQGALKLDPNSSVLQVACLKTLVNYSVNAKHYMLMEKYDIPTLVGQAILLHANDPAVQRYGNYFLGHHSFCCIL